ncbi:MAG: translocation/assembly module TamB [Deltaproteobacteria bacterium]|nr:MAG: translocation/assembly module TamB [Deltaproteobacteria bacterium]
MAGAVGLEADLVLDRGDLDIGRLALRFQHSTVEVGGRVTAVETEPVFDLHLAAPRLAAADLSHRVGDDGAVGVDISVDARLRGPRDALGVSVTVDAGPGGRVTATADGDLLAAPPLWAAALHADAVDIGAILPTVLDGELRLAGLDLSVTGAGFDPTEDGSIVVDARLAQAEIGGERLSDLRAHLAAEDGALVVDSLRLRHPAGVVGARGRAGFADRRAVLDLDADLGDLSALSTLAGTPLAGRARWTPRLSVTWGDEVRLHGSGLLDARAVEGGGVGVDELVGPLRLSWAADGLQLGGESRLAGLVADPVQAAQGTVGWQLAVPGEGGMTLGADIRLGDIHVEGLAGSVGGVDGRLSVELPDAGPPRFGAQVALTDLRTTAGAAPGQGRVEVDLEGERLDAVFDLHHASGGDLLVGEVHRRGRRWTMDELSLGLVPGLSWRSEGPVVAEVEGGVLLRADGILSGPSGRVQVSSDPEHAEWRLQATGLDLAALWRLQELRAADPSSSPAEPDDPAAASLAGRADLDIRAVAPPGGPPQAIDGTVSVARLVVPGVVDGVDLHLAAEGSPDRPRIGLDLSDGPDLLATARGFVPLDARALVPACGEPLSLEMVVAPNELSDLRARLPVLPDISGRVSADLVATGSPCDPDLSLVGAAELPLGTDGENVRVEVQARRKGDRAEATVFLEEGFTRSVRIAGEASTRLGELFAGLWRGEATGDLSADRLVSDFSVAVEPRNVSVDTLRAFVDIPEGVAGRLGGGVMISGTPAAPVVQGALLVLEGRLGRVGISHGGLTVWPEAGGYRGRLELGWAPKSHEETAVGGPAGPAATPQPGGLTLEAFVPLQLDVPLAAVRDQEGLEAELDGVVPLSMLEGVVDGVSEASGALAVHAVVGGSLASPTLRSRVSMNGGALTWLPLGLRYEDIEVAAELTERRLELERLVVFDRRRWPSAGRDLTRPGSLSMQGVVALDDERSKAVQLDARLDRFWIIGRADRSLAVSGPIRAEGRWPALRVEGSVEVNDALMDFGGSLFGVDTTLGLDPRIQVWRGGELITGGIRPPPEPAVWSNFDIDLDIDLRRNLRLIVDVPTTEDYGQQLAQLSQISLDADLGGEVRLRQVDGQLSLQGEIETVRGTSTLLGATFDLSGGTISFLGDGYDNPLVDIHAVRSTSYGDVDVHVSGFVDDLDIAPSSEDYPNQLDVVSLLLFGKPASAFTGGDGQTKVDALALAMASLSGQIERAIGSSVVDELEIDPAGAIRIGKALSDRVFLRLESTTGKLQAEGNRTSVTLEYLITRRMYAEFTTGDRGASSASLFWRWRF